MEWGAQGKLDRHPRQGRRCRGPPSRWQGSQKTQALAPTLWKPNMSSPTVPRWPHPPNFGAVRCPGPGTIRNKPAYRGRARLWRTRNHKPQVMSGTFVFESPFCLCVLCASLVWLLLFQRAPTLGLCASAPYPPSFLSVCLYLSGSPSLWLSLCPCWSVSLCFHLPLSFFLLRGPSFPPWEAVGQHMG